MATLRSYSATFERTALADAAIARYRFSEGTGSDALDSIGDLDGTYESGAAPGTLGSIGDGAASFDGTTGLVLVETAAAGAVVDGLVLDSGSFETWFTTDEIGERQTLFSKNAATSGPGRISAQLREDGSIAIIVSSDDENMKVNSGPGVVEAGAATHVVFTLGDGGMQLFVDGALIDTNDFSGGIDTVEPLVIGAETGFSSPGATLDNLVRFFQGTIDEFAVYDQALTGDEVAQLFEGGEFGTAVVGTADADTIIGGSDAEDLRGGGGDDVLRGRAGDDRLFGGGGVDVLRGGAGDDVLRGGAGNDALNGSQGNDDLFGDRSADELRGGAGDDLLNGGNGRDELIGGSGSDTFQGSQGVDGIRGFEAGPGGDILDLSTVLTLEDGDDVDDFVRLDEVGSDTLVAVDANGGGDSFTAVFNLIGATGLDIGNLVSDGNLQLTSTPS